MRSLSLILGVVLLSASSCAHQPGFCPEAVHPSDSARAWLAELNPPPYVKEYFDRLGDQQEAIEAVCE